MFFFYHLDNELLSRYDDICACTWTGSETGENSSMLKWLRNSSPSSSIFSVRTTDKMENINQYIWEYIKRQCVCIMQFKICKYIKWKFVMQQQQQNEFTSYHVCWSVSAIVIQNNHIIIFEYLLIYKYNIHNIWVSAAMRTWSSCGLMVRASDL